MLCNRPNRKASRKEILPSSSTPLISLPKHSTTYLIFTSNILDAIDGHSGCGEVNFQRLQSMFDVGKCNQQSLVNKLFD